MGAVAWGRWPTPRFPFIEPDVRRYRIRLSDWLHREAHDGAVNDRRLRRRRRSPWTTSPGEPFHPAPCHFVPCRLRLAIQLSLKDPDLLRCYQAHRQSPSPHHLRKHTRSQGPSLHQHYPASTVIRPCPTPARAAASRDVEAAALTQDGSPPITRTTFPTCRAHYPGGSSGCACRLLPRSCGLPQMAGGSASALSLSRPAQASLALPPIGSLSRPRRPLSRGSRPSGHPAEPLVSYQINRQLSGWIPPPLVIRAFRSHCHELASGCGLILFGHASPGGDHGPRGGAAVGPPHPSISLSEILRLE
jgi:hypothetical protein